MKRKSYRPKRVTLLSLILRAAVVVALLTLVFHECFRIYTEQELTQMAEEQASVYLGMKNITLVGNDTESKYDPEQQLLRNRVVLSAISSSGDNDIIYLTDYLKAITEYLFTPEEVYEYVVLNCLNSPDFRSVMAVVDENDEILFTNQMKLYVFLKFSEDKADKLYFICDDEVLDLPEVDQLYADFREIYAEYRKHTEYQSYYEWEDGDEFTLDMELKSAYIDRDSYTIIPHEGVIRLVERKKEYVRNDDGEMESVTNETELQRQEIHIDLTGSDYRLIKLYPEDSGKYPIHGTAAFYGVEPEFIKKNRSSFRYDTWGSGGVTSDRYTSDNIRTVYARPLVQINGKDYRFNLQLMFNLKDKQITAYIMRYTILFACIAAIIAAFWIWRRHTLNKARYAFEDYQRDLTNHLAHDIKTPLMAIGGYAENLIESDLTAEERTRYLHSILDNVAFTDSIISRTLQLGSMEQADPRKREQLQPEELIEAGFRKYAPLLEEKHITYSITGSSTITANRDSFEMLIENLISNTVKYTPENGTIEAVLGKKRITMTNTVTEQIDTKKLTQPFVRGDKVRSNTLGSGLGLSLAERAAESNQMKLVLSSTRTAFKAELKL